MKRNDDDHRNERNGRGFRARARRAAGFAEHPPQGAAAGVGLPGFMMSPGEDEAGQSVRFNEAESRFQMEDARIVTRGNRGFCLRLIEVLVRAGKVRAAHLDFSRNRLAVEFADRATNRAEAARILGESIRLAGMPVDVGARFEAVPVRQNWDAFAFFADAGGEHTSWWWSEVESGQARIAGAGLKIRGVDPRSWSELIPGVRSSRRCRLSRGVNVRFDRDRADLWNIVASIDELCRAIDDRNGTAAPGTGIARTRASRVVHMGLAAGSMSCAIVGILIPGVPTVPFVLLTSYHLAKSSDRMHTMFRRMPLFGSLGEDWESGRYIRTKNKIWLISISTGVLVISLSMAQPGGAALMAIATIYTLTTVSVLAAPGTPRSPRQLTFAPSSRLPNLLPC